VVLSLGATWCPSVACPDCDFGGAGPNIVTVKGHGSTPSQTLVGVGQKSGVYWPFDAKTGATVCCTLVGPGSSLGAVEAGNRVRRDADLHLPDANFYGVPSTLAGGQTGVRRLVCGARSGDRRVRLAGVGAGQPRDARRARARRTGVVFVSRVASGASDVDMFALEPATRQRLCCFASGASVNEAPAIVNGTVDGARGTHLRVPGWTRGAKTGALSSFCVDGN
jgi:polyvinyl alcohol dehydrogenase (cytochrome)